VGKILAQEIIKSKSKTFPPAPPTRANLAPSRPSRGKADKNALVIGLEGELGSGKTTFIQGLAKGLGIKETITSPTFIIFKKFDIPHQPSGIRYFYHIDCYRINQPRELIDLDFKEILNHSQNIIVVEWVERIKKILPPKNILWINFGHLSQDQREITIRG